MATSDKSRFFMDTSTPVKKSKRKISTADHRRRAAIIEGALEDRTDDEMVMVVPASEVPGDPGDPFSERFNTLLRAMANVGYWPFEFGAGTDEYIPLYFLIDEPSRAVRATEHFIRCGGDV